MNGRGQIGTWLSLEVTHVTSHISLARTSDLVPTQMQGYWEEKNMDVGKHLSVTDPESLRAGQWC